MEAGYYFINYYIERSEKMKKYIAEFIGTFTLVFIGCGTAALIGCDVIGGYLATAFAFGLSIVAMAYSIGNISGCHVNPAVSLAVFLSGKMNKEDFISYVVAQCLGAFVAALALWPIVGRASGLGCNGLYNGSYLLSLFIEIILTFIFILSILGVTSKEEFSSVAGLVIGLSLTLVHILGIGLTGTSVNPARSLGPALIVGGSSLFNVWVFIVGPLIGGALAAYVYKMLTEE